VSWLLWRQHRAQVVWSAGLLALFGAAVVVTGIHMADLYSGARADCAGGAPCLLDHLFDGYGAIIDTVHLTLLVPLALGAFVAAPLIAREVDQNTHALVWTQSITRRRWLVSKVAVVVAGSVLLTAAVTALVTWWSGTPNSLGGDRFHGAQFDTQNLVPVAFTLFAVGLGLAAGAALRRTLPAVVATVFGYVAVRMAVGVFIRPHWMAPVKAASSSQGGAPVPSGSWILSVKLLDPQNRSLSGRIPVPQQCAGSVNGRGGLDACMDRLGFHSVTSYHPASHYWPFQIYESALFAVLAAGLIAFAMVRTLRRDA
jgi:hypothetical protein